MKSVRPPLAKVSSKALTGITGFDVITGGGLPRGRTTLLVGGAGPGKTLFALQLLVDAQPTPDLVQSGDFDLSGMLVALKRAVGTLSQTQTVLLAPGLESYGA